MRSTCKLNHLNFCRSVGRRSGSTTKESTRHLKKDCILDWKDWMEYASNLKAETSFDFSMLGDAKKNLKMWRMGNEDKMEARNEKIVQVGVQQSARREVYIQRESFARF